MYNVLVINSSIRTSDSISRSLVNYCAIQIEKLLKNKEHKIVNRDLVQQKLPALTEGNLLAISNNITSDPNIQQVRKISDILIQEIKTANMIIMGIPMYNFSIPVHLKIYFDLIARADITFKYCDKGSQGLLKDKPIAFITTSGGIKHGCLQDCISPYLKVFWNFLGIGNLNFLCANDLASPNKEICIKNAQQEIKNFANTMLNVKK